MRPVAEPSIDAQAPEEDAPFGYTAEIEVKIFDVTTHSRLWPPAGQPGYRSKFSSAGANRYMPQSRTDVLRAQNELALITGEGMSQLFYDVERPQSLRKQ